jgi:hypothetical protein
MTSSGSWSSESTRAIGFVACVVVVAEVAEVASGDLALETMVNPATGSGRGDEEAEAEFDGEDLGTMLIGVDVNGDDARSEPVWMTETLPFGRAPPPPPPPGVDVVTLGVVGGDGDADADADAGTSGVCVGGAGVSEAIVLAPTDGMVVVGAGVGEASGGGSRSVGSYDASDDGDDVRGDEVRRDPVITTDIGRRDAMVDQRYTRTGDVDDDVGCR